MHSIGWVVRRLLTISALLAACNAPSNTPPPQQTRRQTRAGLDAARSDAEQRRSIAARLDRLAQIPSEASGLPSEACENMLAAHRAYMARTGPPGTPRGEQARTKLLMGGCVERPIAVTHCQTYALEHLRDDETELLTAVMNTCAENFGGQ